MSPTGQAAIRRIPALRYGGRARMRMRSKARAGRISIGATRRKQTNHFKRGTSRKCRGCNSMPTVTIIRTVTTKTPTSTTAFITIIEAPILSELDEVGGASIFVNGERKGDYLRRG